MGIRIPRLDVRAKVILLVASFVIGLLGFAGATYRAVQIVKVGGPHYREIVQRKDIEADVLPPPLYIIETMLLTRMIVDADSAGLREQLIAKIAQLEIEYKVRTQYWQEELAEGELQIALLERSGQAASRVFAIANTRVIPLVRDGDIVGARAVVLGPLAAAYDEHRRAVDEVVTLSRQEYRLHETLVAKAIRHQSLGILAVGAAILAVVTSLGWIVGKDIVRLTSKLAHLNDSLEEAVAERTADLVGTQRRLEREIADRERMEQELRLAQKLEAVGQLAAGIAHEINTPMQYLSDSLHFVQKSFERLMHAFLTWENAFPMPMSPAAPDTAHAKALDAREDARIAHMQMRVPRAFGRMAEGIERVTTIIRAMKDFAHPDQKEKSQADINKAILNSLIVSRSEHKYVAEVETKLAELPLVECHLGEINQVLLNLIVNAAHAIGDAVQGTDAKGRIGISTELSGERVVIKIEDSGRGVPDAIRDRIFDPFFTTKPVGKGTGQGLALARTIVDRHDGSLTFTTEPGRGTTFRIELPVSVSRSPESGSSV